MALRAVDAGKRVYIAQFVKGRNYSKITAIREHLPRTTIRQFDRGCLIEEKPTNENVAAAREGLAAVVKVLQSGKQHLV